MADSGVVVTCRVLQRRCPDAGIAVTGRGVHRELADGHVRRTRDVGGQGREADGGVVYSAGVGVQRLIAYGGVFVAGLGGSEGT